MLPQRAISAAQRLRLRLKRAQINAQPALTLDEFKSILLNELGLTRGDHVLVHSSIDHLHLDFSFGQVLSLLREVISEEGTILFPTYPGIPSYQFLKQDEVFDVTKTPSFMGILTEYARRQPDAVRSLHPTKSVCALGRLAREFTTTHAESPYPFDRCSPYYKLVEHGGKTIGLGVSTERNSFVHCVEDVLKNDFPVRVHHAELFTAHCIDEAGKPVTVETFAHDLSRMNHDIPRYVRKHISRNACSDLTINGMRFFRAQAAELFGEMSELARQGITIYSGARIN